MRGTSRRLVRALDDRLEVDLRRAAVFGVVALVALVTGHELNREHPTMDASRVVSFGCAVLVLVAGVLATRSAAKEIASTVSGRAGSAAAAPLRVLVQVVGYLFVLLGVLDVLGIDLSQFLVGGAVTGVVIGIAAQQTLGNFFAGLVLLMARPYAAGDLVTVHSGAINGPHTGTVTDVGLLYTSLDAEVGLLRIPNSVLLASAVSLGAPPPVEATLVEPPSVPEA